MNWEQRESNYPVSLLRISLLITDLIFLAHPHQFYEAMEFDIIQYLCKVISNDILNKDTR